MKTKLFILFLSYTFFAYSQKWENRYEDAKSTAKSSKKALLLVFAGSDWCAPCVKLDKNVFRSSVFQEFAQQELVLYKADFPRKKSNKLALEIQKVNKQLAEKFNPKGYFPLVVVLDDKESVLGTFGYVNQPVSHYTSLIKTFLK